MTDATVHTVLADLDNPFGARMQSAATALLDRARIFSEAVEPLPGLEANGEDVGAMNAVCHSIQAIIRAGHVRGMTDAQLFASIAGSLGYFLENQGLGPIGPVARQLAEKAVRSAIMQRGAPEAQVHGGRA